MEVQRLLRRLHARFHPDDVADVGREPLVQPDEEVERAAAAAPRRLDEGLEPGTDRPGRHERRQVARERRLVGERQPLRLGLEEEVEGVDDRDLGDQIDLDREMRGLLGEDESGEVVAVRILQPVQEVRRRPDFERVAQDPRPAMRRRAQAHRLRR